MLSATTVIRLLADIASELIVIRRLAANVSDVAVILLPAVDSFLPSRDESGLILLNRSLFDSFFSTSSLVLSGRTINTWTWRSKEVSWPAAWICISYPFQHIP
jgi:hypothetical protein